MMGCEVDIGDCNESAATRVVYTRDGRPAYEGQAMVALSCGNQSYCHSSTATGEGRFGAPIGLNFDVFPASYDGVASPEQTERLRIAQANVNSYSGHIFATVESGTMPPWGESTLSAHEETPRFASDSGERLPFVDSFEGVEIVRNWVACGAPVVERSDPRPDGVPAVGDIVEVQGSI